MELKILKGQNALITGATGGIGKQIVHELAIRGCNVFLTGRDESILKDLSTELSRYSVAVFSEVVD